MNPSAWLFLEWNKKSLSISSIKVSPLLRWLQSLLLILFVVVFARLSFWNIFIHLYLIVYWIKYLAVFIWRLWRIELLLLLLIELALFLIIIQLAFEVSQVLLNIFHDLGMLKVLNRNQSPDAQVRKILDRRSFAVHSSRSLGDLD